MGANLQRVAFREWLGEWSEPEEREELLRAIHGHLSEKICVDEWNIVERRQPYSSSWLSGPLLQGLQTSLIFCSAGRTLSALPK